MASDQPVAFVTGASSGIGKACAEKLAALGFLVYGTSRRPEFHSAHFHSLRMDVTDDESVKGAVQDVLGRHQRIDCVINNAGFGLGGSIEDTSIAEASRQFDTNLFGAMRVCRSVLPVMRQQRSGLIINISSLGGLFGLPFQGIYSASKFALEGFSESLRLETRQYGIRVVLVEPGDVKTAITKNRVLAAACHEGSSYTESFSRTLAVIEKEEAGGIPPEEIAARVARIVISPRPRFRYTVGHPTQRLSAWIRRFAPWPVFERILLSFYGLTPPGSPPPGSGQPDRAPSAQP
jgi:NAD(P)-dependent dehydrogenase (short-subunit alcohol dehydrogenase family)